MPETHPPRRNLAARLLRARTVPARKQAAPKAKRNLSMTLREWHKRAGLFAFLFMGWLGASGVLLNQSVSLSLDAERVDWSWLMSMYGLHPEPPQNGYLADGHWLASTAEYTLVDGQPLDQRVIEPLGLAVGGSDGEKLLYIAAADVLVLITPEGQRVDQLQGYTLPVDTIRRIGQTGDGQVAIQDLDVYATRDGLDWQPLTSTAGIVWSQAQSLSDAQRAQTMDYARPSMPVEQVLIDAHSGRLFGRAGPWVINAVGVAAILLAITGIWMMWRTRQNRRRAQR